MKLLRTILSKTSLYIHGDRYSFFAIAVLLTILCSSTIFLVFTLAQILPDLLNSVFFSVDVPQPPTPYSYRDCKGGEPYSGTWSEELEGMHFEAHLCPDETLIAIFHNQDIPESITINHRPSNQLEFSWGVSVNVDAKMTTGSPAGNFEGIVGAEYQLLLAHWSRGKEETVPLSDAYQVNVWQFTEAGSSKVISDAESFIDRQEELLVLRGSIPGMNSESKVLFSRFYQSIYHESTYKTKWSKSDG